MSRLSFITKHHNPELQEYILGVDISLISSPDREERRGVREEKKVDC